MTRSCALFDSHVHYNLTPIYEHWPQAVLQAQQQGVVGGCVIGTDIGTCQRALFLRSQRSDFFCASLGLHPDLIDRAYHQHAGDWDVIGAFLINQLASLRRLACDNQFDAWGEIGLDYYHLDPHSSDHTHFVRWQNKLFARQLSLANKYPKPIILHVRDRNYDFADINCAYHQVLYFLRLHSLTDKPLIFHCFSGPPAYLEAILSLPHSYVSFAGNLTFKSANDLRAALALVPQDRLLLETDSPFLSPEPVRGQPCQPAFLRHTADFAASLGVDLQQVYHNTLAILGEGEV